MSFMVNKKKVSRTAYYRWQKMLAEKLQNEDDVDDDDTIATMMDEDDNFETHEEENFMMEAVETDAYNNVGIGYQYCMGRNSFNRY